MSKIRLDKLLSHSGYGTRKEVHNLIKNKSVKVNGVVAVKSDMKIDSDLDQISVDYTDINYQKYVYLVMNKPQGYICATNDYKHPIILELIEEYYHDIFPVGRLDKDTEGLILITNDGGFAHRLISGNHDIEKEYFVRLEKPFDANYIKAIEEGIAIDNDICKPAKVELYNDYELTLTITEGKYHQVKRMMEACANKVVYLKRTRIHNLMLDDSLELGSYRHLTEDEKSILEA